MESGGEKVTCLNFYFIVLISSHWNVEGEMGKFLNRLYEGSGGFPARMGAQCFKADAQGGSGPGWSELGEQWITCFHLGVLEMLHGEKGNLD